MVSQAKSGCRECGSVFHTRMYHKPMKPLKRTAIKIKPIAPKKKRAESRSQVVKKLDTVFSQYIRLKDAVDGQASCVTCGTTKEWKGLQNGHFYTRGRYPTRWDELNCHVQCVACNVFLNGNYIMYTKYMFDRYGRDAVDLLELKSLTPVKIPTFILKEYIEHYKNKIKEKI